MTDLWAFIVAILVLVTIHEWGHYWVARRCGVRIEKFSIGFGKPLLSWTNKEGTVFCIAMIPLGGYVKMAGEYSIVTDENAEPQNTEGTFPSKSVWQRMAIVVAGPAVNLIFAALVFVCLGYGNRQVTLPNAQMPAAQSLAANLGMQTGDVVTQINDRSVADWSDVSREVLVAVFDKKSIDLSWRNAVGEAKSGRIDVSALSIEQSDWQEKIGLLPQVMPMSVGSIVNDKSAAAQAGLQVGDIVVAVNGQTTESLESRKSAVKRIQASAGQVLTLDVLRNGQALTLNVTPQAQEVGVKENGQTVTKTQGMIGVGFLQTQTQQIHVGAMDALKKGLDQAVFSTRMTAKGLYKMATGQLSLKNIGGPVSIAQVMGEGAKSGVRDFVNVLAWLSVSLGVLNLLPIPTLDGGHLMYYVIEVFKGKPVSPRVLAVGQAAGMAFLLMFMGIAFYNDFMRLFS
jgi:regulator of sigma E protease